MERAISFDFNIIPSVFPVAFPSATPSLLWRQTGFAGGGFDCPADGKLYAEYGWNGASGSAGRAEGGQKEWGVPPDLVYREPERNR